MLLVKGLLVSMLYVVSGISEVALECINDLGPIAIGRQDLQFDKIIDQRWVVTIGEMNDGTDESIHILLFNGCHQSKVQ